MSNGYEPDDVLHERGEDIADRGTPVELPPKKEGNATTASDVKAGIDNDALRKQLDAGDMRNAGARALDWLHKVATGEVTPIALPWENVNRELGGGLWRGCHVVVGNPKTGKSQWALQVAMHAAKHGSPVAYVALELDDRDVWTRLLGIESNRKWSRLALGSSKDNGAELAALASKHLTALDALPISIIHGDAMGWDPKSLPALVCALREKYPAAKGLPLVIVDFLQLVSGDGRELRERIGKASYAARMAARETNAAIVLISATSRENYGALDSGSTNTKAEVKERAKNGPLGEGPTTRFMGLGKESGEIEYSADSVTVLVRDPDAALDGDKASLVWVAVAAIRAKPDNSTGWASLRFNGGRFNESNDQPQTLADPSDRTNGKGNVPPKAKQGITVVTTEDWNNL